LTLVLITLDAFRRWRLLGWCLALSGDVFAATFALPFLNYLGSLRLARVRGFSVLDLALRRLAFGVRKLRLTRVHRLSFLSGMLARCSTLGGTRVVAFKVWADSQIPIDSLQNLLFTAHRMSKFL
jgi:hypothetical protein